MKPRDDVEIGLLIGVNCPRAIKPCEVIPGADDNLYAVRTSLGWGIIGSISAPTDIEDIFGVNNVVSRFVENGKITRRCYFACRTVTKDLITPIQVNKMLEQDFSESIEGKPLSFEDRKFMEIVSKGIHRLPVNHFEIPLPLKESNIKLQNNQSLALHCLYRLKKIRSTKWTIWILWKKLSKVGKQRRSILKFQFSLNEARQNLCCV